MPKRRHPTIYFFSGVVSRIFGVDWRLVIILENSIVQDYLKPSTHRKDCPRLRRDDILKQSVRLGHSIENPNNLGRIFKIFVCTE